MRRSQAPSSKRLKNDENEPPSGTQAPKTLTCSSGISLGGCLGLSCSLTVGTAPQLPGSSAKQLPTACAQDGPTQLPSRPAIQQFKCPMPFGASQAAPNRGSLGMKKKYGAGVDLLAALHRRVVLQQPSAAEQGAGSNAVSELVLYDPEEHRLQLEMQLAEQQKGQILAPQESAPAAAAAAEASPAAASAPGADAAGVADAAAEPAAGGTADGAAAQQQTQAAALVPALPAPPKPGVGGIVWEKRVKVFADAFLVEKLRPHQREGVKFVFECLSGVRKDGCFGAVLADGMGLGKTFQTIASLYCLLTKGINGAPTCKKPLILCPTSLVQNWGKELKHWLGDRVASVVVDDTRADHVKRSLQDFRSYSIGNKPRVLVMSYPCFRMHKAEIYRLGIDVVLCDEAHFLKNGEAQITQAVAGLSARRRLLMSGTPIQNDLSEFHAVFDLACPGLLGSLMEFRKRYELPIQNGRDSGASDKQVSVGLERMAELMGLCNRFMLRRTSSVLKKLLPPKVEQVVFCKLSPLQLKLYNAFLQSKPVQALLASTAMEEGPDGAPAAKKRRSTKKAAAPAADGEAGAGEAATAQEQEPPPPKPDMLAPLAAITALKKLCCHPDLIHDMLNKHKAQEQQKAQQAQLAEMMQAQKRMSARAGAAGKNYALLAAGVQDDDDEEEAKDKKKGGKAGSGRKSSKAGNSSSARQQLTGFEGCGELFSAADVYPAYQPRRCQAYHSGKVMVLEALLKAIHASEPTDKAVLVSNYTEALDVLGVMCASHGWVTLRLDGSCSVKQRQALVDTFNDPQHPSFVLLLSSKAGGVGLNIIGANRLVLFDPDWNPANDLQAMARVWREGQAKRVWIYRLLMAGSIEEKVLQRQLAKQGLSEALVDEVGQQVRTFSRDELRSLFRVNPHIPCDTHAAIKCGCDGSLAAMASCKERAAASACGSAGEEDGAGAEQQQGVLAWAHLAKAVDSPDPTWGAVLPFVRDNFVTYVFSDHVLDEQQQPAEDAGAGGVGSKGKGSKKRRRQEAAAEDAEQGSASGKEEVEEEEVEEEEGGGDGAAAAGKAAAAAVAAAAASSQLPPVPRPSAAAATAAAPVAAVPRPPSMAAAAAPAADGDAAAGVDAAAGEALTGAAAVDGSSAGEQPAPAKRGSSTAAAAAGGSRKSSKAAAPAAARKSGGAAKGGKQAKAAASGGKKKAAAADGAASGKQAGKKSSGAAAAGRRKSSAQDAPATAAAAAAAGQPAAANGASGGGLMLLCDAAGLDLAAAAAAAPADEFCGHQEDDALNLMLAHAEDNGDYYGW